MIQRIQSIWLFLTAAAAFLSLKFPFYYGSKNEIEKEYALTGTENLYLMGITILILVIALVTIFLYNNRGLQFRMCITGILFEGLLLFLYYREMQIFLKGTLALTAILQICILIFFFLAARGIRNDDRLIKESDRFR